MQSFVFNIAKGRVAEFVHRVDTNDPANSALIVVPLIVGGTAAQGQDFDTLATFLADVNFVEATTGGWSRKTLTDAQTADINIDDNANVVYGAIPQIIWTAPTVSITGLVICYDNDTTAGTDANIIPLTAHSFPVTANGSQVTLDASNFYRAS